MKDIQEAVQKVKSILKEVEESKAETLKEIEEAESKRKKAKEEAERSIAEGDISKYSQAKAEEEALQKRIDFLQGEKSFADMEKEINEIQDFAKKCVDQAIKETGDIYYKAWIEGLRAEKKAESVRSNASWIIRETDRLLNRSSFCMITQNVYKGMLVASQERLEYIEAWKRLRNRTKK